MWAAAGAGAGALIKRKKCSFMIATVKQNYIPHLAFDCYISHKFHWNRMETSVSNKCSYILYVYIWWKPITRRYKWSVKFMWIILKVYFIASISSSEIMFNLCLYLILENWEWGKFFDNWIYMILSIKCRMPILLTIRKTIYLYFMFYINSFCFHFQKVRKSGMYIVYKV